ncbi:hypothetical protein QH494_02565 [Sphingomonas sp. AR_OL41]|uniref:hypothetical protein n=1 Tax=Sphingomonas sp. AR_OL41 TaxID=3042729 RepID=UPI0024806493|nr:hypothetical protein [Sphingomonas sp. AR_OL41]MDH7971052.1 hypothetical protein [Sphingomonas sp. AR_OL41]
MALQDLLKLVDDKLADVFAAKPHDPAKDRAPLLKGIDKTATQYANPEPVKGRKWWKAANNVVAFAPQHNGAAFPIGGKETVYVPSERFPDFLKAFKASVEAGEFDAQLKGGTTPVKAATAGTKRAGWSPERRAAQMAAIAAKKAKKA